MNNKKVIIGGTFEFLHAGHIALLRKAFELGDVKIGITSDMMAKAAKAREVAALSVRKTDLEDFIKNEIGREAEIIEIQDKFGPTLKEDFDYIVVSPETYEIAILINEGRKMRRKKLIKIIEIEYVLAEDRRPISSTRIFEGEIDKEGKLLK